jgi:hypothetical protein
MPKTQCRAGGFKTTGALRRALMVLFAPRDRPIQRPVIDARRRARPPCYGRCWTNGLPSGRCLAPSSSGSLAMFARDPSRTRRARPATTTIWQSTAQLIFRSPNYSPRGRDALASLFSPSSSSWGNSMADSSLTPRRAGRGLRRASNQGGISITQR